MRRSPIFREEARADNRTASGGPLYLDLKSDSGNFRVFLGPPWFVESKNFKFANGDQVEVTGSKAGKSMIIAREVKKDGQVLTLRNAQGVPEWSGK
jgi:hypothetical protein